MKLLLVVLTLMHMMQAALAGEPSSRLINALIMVESSNNDYAIGDRKLKEKAYGCLQIRQPVCDDVNRRYKTKYKAEQCLGNRALSIEICKKYLKMYGTSSSDSESLARIWNGGPRGAFKESTQKYWKKVQNELS